MPKVKCRKGTADGQSIRGEKLEPWLSNYFHHRNGIGQGHPNKPAIIESRMQLTPRMSGNLRKIKQTHNCCM